MYIYFYDVLLTILCISTDMNFKRVLPEGDNDPDRAYKMAKLDNIPIISEDKVDEIDSDEDVGLPEEEESSGFFSKIGDELVIIEENEDEGEN